MPTLQGKVTSAIVDYSWFLSPFAQSQVEFILTKITASQEVILYDW